MEAGSKYVFDSDVFLSCRCLSLFVMFKLSDKLESGSFKAAVSNQKKHYIHPSSNQPAPFLLYPSLSRGQVSILRMGPKNHHP